ncbi:CPBP family glutamic-type intramembrane protease [Kribbella sp. NPDC023855]
MQGLFLGYLWSRYRRMWPLITVHGAVNFSGYFCR